MKQAWIKYLCITLFTVFMVSGSANTSYAGKGGVDGDVDEDPFGLASLLVSDTEDPFCGKNSKGCEQTGKCTAANKGNTCSATGTRSESSDTAPSRCYCCRSIEQIATGGGGNTRANCESGAVVK